MYEEWNHWEPSWLAWCDKCKKWTRVTESGGFTGFAGGRCYWASFACGHTDMDESADLLAAV